jgi:alkylation response protein AidB-like acyl-CoA dehydrogenase
MSERGTTHGRAHNTRLHRDDDGVLRLTGVKHYVTGGPSATWLSVGARGENGRKVVAFVLRESPGIDVRHDWTGMGQRSTASGSVALDAVAVDPAFVWREAGGADSSRALAKLLHGAISAGIAEGALDDAARFVVSRARPRPAAALAGIARAAEDPYVTLRLGELTARTAAAAALVRDVARRIDEGAADVEADVAAAHAHSGEVAVAVTGEIFTLMGAAAADERHDLHRHWRDARTHSLQDARDWRLRLAGERLLARVEQDPNRPNLQGVTE